VEEILEDDGLTVSSLVVQFTLPNHIKNADCLQLLFEPDAAYTGGALAVKSADANGELQQLCRVVLPITVDQGGTQANLMIPPEDAERKPLSRTRFCPHAYNPKKWVYWRTSLL
jgi:hypothetical protein